MIPTQDGKVGWARIDFEWLCHTGTDEHLAVSCIIVFDSYRLLEYFRDIARSHRF